MAFRIALLILNLLVSLAYAIPSPKDLRSDVTIVVANDLEGPDSPSADVGLLYLSRKQSFSDAIRSCHALGEELWNPSPHEGKAESLLERIKSEQESPGFWVASEEAKQQWMALDTGRLVNADHDSIKLPVICTQRAPYSNSTVQDSSREWQVKVRSNNEELVGYRDHQTFRFLGVRYAPEPERFAYSKVYHGTGGTVSALEYGSQCAQAGAGSEDCLFMNIFTPHLPEPGRKSRNLRPVMLWIHGGAFIGGTANDPVFDGANIVSRGDVVLVSVNYRLSTFGYLALDDGETNGNFGLADQILALDWVREHIHDFGGDPNCITVFGQSAGAGSVRALMASPKTVGKFARAIPMSNLGGLAYGTTYSKYYTIEEEMKAVGNAILEETNCTRAASKVDCLRNVDTSVLASTPTVARFLVIDGTYLTSNELPLGGPKAPYDLMMGITAEDGAPFITYPLDVGPRNKSWLTEQDLPYPPRSLFPLPDLTNRTLAVDRMAARLATDAMFRCVDQATVYAGLRNGMFDKVYYYEFERTYQILEWPNLDLCEPPKSQPRPNGDPEAEIGYSNCHSGELLSVFGNIRRLGLPYRDGYQDKAFEREILDRWAAFAWTGNPNIPSESATWKPAVKDRMRMMILDLPHEKMEPFRDLEQCKWLGLPIDYYI